MKRAIRVRAFGLILALTAAPAAAQTWVPQETGAAAEIRGLSAVGEDVVWAGARGGVWVRTDDGGATWTTGTVPGAEELFFIDAHAVGADTAFLLGTHFEGGLARVYRTTDGGASWDLQYEREGAGVFFDGMAFWDANHGVAFGDPVGGTFTVIRTDDGGASWQEVPPDRLPPALPAEAGFAASGTAIVTVGDSAAVFGTGSAAVARVFVSRDRGRSWTAVETPMPGGLATGTFGVAFRDEELGLAVGGNHTLERDAEPNVLRTRDGGRTWELAGWASPASVRYGVVASGGVFVAVGPGGTGLTRDGGETWRCIPGEGYNTVAAGSEGVVWAAGTDGRIARLRLED